MAFTPQEDRAMRGIDATFLIFGAAVVLLAGYGVIKTSILITAVLLILGLGLISFPAGYALSVSVCMVIIFLNVYTAGIKYEREHPGEFKIESVQK